MITPRLKCIIDHTKGNRIADIGTDHAYIPIYLVKNDLAEYVIAGDVRQGPVDIAKANVEKHKLPDKIEVRLGSGLSVIEKGEVDTVIIAGMGGQLISEILSADIEKVRECNLANISSMPSGRSSWQKTCSIAARCDVFRFIPKPHTRISLCIARIPAIRKPLDTSCGKQ